MNNIHDNSTSFHARWSEDRQKAQPLSQHLVGVAELAECFARDAQPEDEAFSVSARLAGLLHDLGKYRTEFQKYLSVGDRGKRSVETDHAVYGAAAAGEWAIAFAIGGHHTGLHDWESLNKLVYGQKYHAQERYPRLLEVADEPHELTGRLRALLFTTEDSTVLSARLNFDDDDLADKRRFEAFVRMLFSILVDADRLDSERFEQQHRLGRAWTRTTKALDAAGLLNLLREERQRRAAKRPDDELTRLRNSVFETCVASGEQGPQGFYSLTVPTGGGKTLSSMAFALAHAQRWDLRRVFVVIPYLSIIEQNAGIYRTVLGADQVLEHHSSVEVVARKQASASEDSSDPPQVLDVERAMENWDVPIVVTTSVQFLETLFAAATGRARKLHNVARSVVIFDEVQTLPTHLLEPTLDMLRTLQKHFGVSFLFCSATQPAFRKSGNLKQGFREDELKPVIADPGELFRQLQRVNYDIRPQDERWNWERLAQEMLAKPQALAVVNLRQHAFDAYNAVKDSLTRQGRGDEASEAVFHLSSAMCPAHRLDMLGLSKPTRIKNNIKWRLENKLPCWVVSTQLIEAGVDIDFPVVFRAMGPLDSIVQAAGRCNREGQLRNEFGNLILGNVIVFHPELPDGSTGLPPGLYDKATKITPSYLGNVERLATDVSVFADYFNELFQITQTDRARRGEKPIQEHRANLNFRTVAERAKVIDEPTIAVVVRYGQAIKLIDRIRKARRVDRGTLRRLQRYMVNLRFGSNTLYQHLLDAGFLTDLHPDLNLKVVDSRCYDLQRGIVLKDRTPEDFFA